MFQKKKEYVTYNTFLSCRYASPYDNENILFKHGVDASLWTSRLQGTYVQAFT
jgi:hypothetical protein